MWNEERSLDSGRRNSTISCAWDLGVRVCLRNREIRERCGNLRELREKARANIMRWFACKKKKKKKKI